MIYIFCATKSEAQAIVEYKKLQKTKLFDYTLYRSSDICLIVTGVGLKNAKKAALFCKERLRPLQSDTILNIGIAAAPKNIAIGSLCRISNLLCNGKTVQIDQNGYTLESVTTPQSTQKEHLIDMEACAIVEVFGKKVHIYKIVSDHFKPESLTKDGVKKMITASLQDIQELQ